MIMGNATTFQPKIHDQEQIPRDSWEMNERRKKNAKATENQPHGREKGNEDEKRNILNDLANHFYHFRCLHATLSFNWLSDSRAVVINEMKLTKTHHKRTQRTSAFNLPLEWVLPWKVHEMAQEKKINTKKERAQTTTNQKDEPMSHTVKNVR